MNLSLRVAHNVNNSTRPILVVVPDYCSCARLIRRSGHGSGTDRQGRRRWRSIIRRIQDFVLRQQPGHEFQVGVSISDLMKDAWEMTRPRWESRRGACQKCVLRVRPELRGLRGMGDPVELREVLVNV